MTDKEKNRAIYDRLLELACEVWEGVKKKAPEGSYTAMQVHELLPTIEVGDACVEMTVRVDGFRCTFLSTDVFRLLHQFAKLAGVKTEERHKFVHMKEQEVKMSATVRVEKRHKDLKKMVGNDPIRPVMSYLYLDAKRSRLVALDGRIMAAMKIDMTLHAGGDGERAGFLLTPSFVDKPMEMLVVERTDGSFCWMGDGVDNFTRPDYARYPRWESVLPNLSEELHFNIGKEGVKQLNKFVKSVLKMPYQGWHVLVFYADSYEDTLHVCYDYDEENIHAHIDLPMLWKRGLGMQVGLGAEWVSKLIQAWNGSFWYVDGDRAVTFDTDAQDTILLMPNLIEDGKQHLQPHNSGVKFDIPSFDRYGEADENNETKTNQTIIIMGYPINVLAAGTYEVRGQKQENLTADIRKMAAYIMEREEVMRKCQEFFNQTYGRGAEAQKHYPLPEREIHNMMHASLLEQGIEICPKQTYSSPTPPTDEPIHLEPGSTVCITGTLLHSRKHYETEIAVRGWTFAPRLTKSVDLLVCADDYAESMSSKVKKAMEFGTRTCTAQQFYDLLERTPILKQETKQEPAPEPEPERKPAPTGHLQVVAPQPKPQEVDAPQEEPAVKIERTTAMVGRRLLPLLVLSQGDTQVIVAGNSLYEAICNEEGEIRPMYQELFDSTDAFVDDELLMSEELDEAAICEAVSEFMDMVERAV